MTRTSSLLLIFLLSLPCAAFAQVNINFKNNPQLSHHDQLYFLRLPYIDQYGGIPALYQDATIQYSPTTKTWSLYSYMVAEPIAETEIENVNLVITGAVPVQVFLEITGHFAYPCAGAGHAGVRQDGANFSTYVFYSMGMYVSSCVGNAPPAPFRKVVPLDVYGLAAGTYTYDVQGKFSGSFTLAADNVLE